MSQSVARGVAWQVVGAELHPYRLAFCAGSKFVPGRSLVGFVRWWWNKAIVIVKSCIQLSAVAYVVECRGDKHSSNGEVGLRVKCRLLDARCTDSSSPVLSRSSYGRWASRLHVRVPTISLCFVQVEIFPEVLNCYLQRKEVEYEMEVLNGNINWHVSVNADNARRWPDSGCVPVNSDVPEQNLPQP